MSNIRISGCIITQGAPELLKQCLQDMDFADELIVVDGAPDRETQAVTESNPKGIYIAHPWTNNISAQRNVYMRAARGAWIFTLDTDERLEAGFSQEMETWIQRKDIDGYCFPRCWRVDQEKFVLSQYHYPDFNLRLIRNRPGLHYLDSQEYAVHHAFNKIEQPLILLDTPVILHDCFLYLTRQERQDKIKLYDQMSSNQSGSRYKPFYLFEDYPHRICPLAKRPKLESFPQVLNVNAG